MRNPLILEAEAFLDRHQKNKEHLNLNSLDGYITGLVVKGDQAMNKSMDFFMGLYQGEDLEEKEMQKLIELLSGWTYYIIDSFAKSTFRPYIDGYLRRQYTLPGARQWTTAFLLVSREWGPVKGKIKLQNLLVPIVYLACPEKIPEYLAQNKNFQDHVKKDEQENLIQELSAEMQASFLKQLPLAVRGIKEYWDQEYQKEQEE